MSAFPGFPTETQAFLRELRQNNTREWFAANKPSYLLLPLPQPIAYNLFMVR